MVTDDVFEFASRVAGDADNGDRIIMHRNAYLYRRAGPESTADSSRSAGYEPGGEYPALDERGKKGRRERISHVVAHNTGGKPQGDPERNDQVNDEHKRRVWTIEREKFNQDGNFDENTRQDSNEIGTHFRTSPEKGFVEVEKRKAGKRNKRKPPPTPIAQRKVNKMTGANEADNSDDVTGGEDADYRGAGRGHKARGYEFHATGSNGRCNRL